jgi:predicted helicase
LLIKNGRIQIAKDIKKSGMITSAIQQIVNTDRTELKDCVPALSLRMSNAPALI